MRLVGAEASRRVAPRRCGCCSLARVNFRITPHAASGAPGDALEMLWQHLDGHYEDVSFVNEGPEIKARIAQDAPIAMTSDEREAVGRRMLLELLREVCERSSELSSDWYAVSSDQ